MSTFYDVFNGDADGICALHQLRLADPRTSELITGAKRDIELVARVPAQAGDVVTVLDISMARNAAALQSLLDRGATCRYFDHHSAGTIPVHERLEAHIDTAREVCTSLIVDRVLEGRYRAWAVVAAFGDNLTQSALAAAAPLKLNEFQLGQLQELGECLNYNAYGASVEDLHYHPADLYRSIARYYDPLQFVTGEPVLEVLRTARGDDLSRAAEIDPVDVSAHSAVYVLPDEARSRRVNGTYINRLATAYPERAHAMLVSNGNGYAVSVRAPVADPREANVLCRKFGGEGRVGAAGIDDLPQANYDAFIAAFKATYAA